ncbi:MAG: HD domain-containing phosphohydrolase [Thermodesulfobacteriota bacterium]
MSDEEQAATTPLQTNGYSTLPRRLAPQFTETIDLPHVPRHRMTESGSFELVGISSTAIGSLLDALPIPVLCIDSSLSVRFANKACSKIAETSEDLQGRSILRIMPRDQDIDLMHTVTANILATRKPQIAEGMIRRSNGNMWGRMHFRSIRILGERLVLILIEDLTPEKRQLILKDRHEKEIQEARCQLETRVNEATAELSRVNSGLRREIAYRRQVEEKLRQSLVKFKRTLDGTITALAALAEKRDPYVAGHQFRVARLACSMATHMGLSDDRVKGIGIAAAMHDIGKICVPAELLSKPGRISEHEYGIIRAHPEIGYDILRVIEFPWPLAEIALQHHERIDGSGYPRGLKGEEMLLESRIIAVADVVEAMSSHRPYRPALDLRDAIKEIWEHRGVLYDSTVVDACLKVIRNGIP